MKFAERMTPHILIWQPEEDIDGLNAQIRTLSEQSGKLEAIATRHRLKSLEIVPSVTPEDQGVHVLHARVEGHAEPLTHRDYYAVQQDIQKETGVDLEALNPFSGSTRESTVESLQLRRLYDNRLTRAASSSAPER